MILVHAAARIDSAKLHLFSLLTEQDSVPCANISAVTDSMILRSNYEITY